MNRQQSLLLIITVFGFVIPGITHATSYTVTTTDDEIDGSPSCITGSSTDCSLREAIEVANANTSGDHTIILDAVTYTLSIATPPLNGGLSVDNDDNADGDLDITNTSSTITIIGAGPDDTIINGDGSVMLERVLEVVNGDTDLILQDLRITDGNDANNGVLRGGGAVYTDGNLTLDTVQIESNSAGVASADGKGGGIYVTADGALVMTDSILTNNTSGQHGGGIYSEGSVTITNSEILTNSASSTTTFVRGGGINNTSGTLTITSSEITGNTAESTANNTFGGGVYSFENSTTTVTNSTISGNTVSSDVGSDSFGGGSFVYDNTATVTLKHATVADNTAEAGGGIGGEHTLKHTIIGDNTASNLDDDDDCYGTMISASGFNVLEDHSPNCDGMDSDTTNTLDEDAGLDNSLDAVDGPDYYPFSDPATSVAVNSIPASNCVTVLGGSPVDQLGNNRVGECDAGAFEFQDTTDPVISVVGGTANAECGDAYTDAGATATDTMDGSIEVTADTTDVDADVLGSYTVSYSASDQSNNTDTATRTVNVIDTTDPTVILTGASTVTLQQGDDYTERSATGSDDCDSSVTITRSGSVDTTTPGEYVLTYTGTDDSDNSDGATRTVIVESLGDVESLTRLSNNRVRLEYSTGETRTFEVFSRGSAKPKAVLSVDRERIVAMNKKAKKIRVLNAFTGEILTSKRLNSKPQHKARLKVKKLYRNKPYDSVIIATTRNERGRIIVYRLTSNDTLTKKKRTNVTITDNTRVRIQIKRAKKRFITTFGTRNSSTRNVWKIKRRGGLLMVQ